MSSTHAETFPTQVVAQLIPDTDAPDLGPLLVAELAKRNGCPSFGSFLVEHPECSGCLLRRPCESRLALSVLSEAQDLARLDHITAEAGVSDLLGPNITTGPRMPTNVKRKMST